MRLIFFIFFHYYSAIFNINLLCRLIIETLATTQSLGLVYEILS